MTNMNAGEMKIHLTAYLNGHADAPTKLLIESWLRDKQNLQAFYDYLFQFESDNPLISTNAEKALAQLNVRFYNLS